MSKAENIVTKMIQQLTARRAELVARSDASTDVAEVRSIYEQLQKVNSDIAELEQAKADDAAAKDERTITVNGADNLEKRGEVMKFVQGEGFKAAVERGLTDSLSEEVKTREKAGTDLKEKRAVAAPFGVFGELRAVTIGTGTEIVVPRVFSPTINTDFNAVSSLIDSVAHLSLNGGESYRQPYVAGIDVGNYTGEGADTPEAETHFAYVDINKAKVTAYAELTEELFKLPNAAYADAVFQNIRNSMRMLLTKEILVGAGNTNQLVGIFSDKATAIDSGTDLDIKQIDDTTLDKIVYTYGGSEDVETPAVLILSKTDLLAFAKVRTSTTLRYYSIESQGNFGTINGVPFIINSACNAISGKTTVAGDYCMAYGNPSNYQLVEFSPMEVKMSDDFKFRQGMTAYRGVAFVGGNVVKKNGFLRIKKAAG